MARWLALLFALFAAVPAGAEMARVTGGEHDDFTRLVVEVTKLGDWKFGRAADGYELDLGTEVAGYDVTQAFARIPRDRITALWRDPESGRLRFSLACACYAMAFEFRAGIVVIDIKSGAAPAGSAFESALDGGASATDTGDAADTTVPQPAADAAPSYDWVALQRKGDAEFDDLPLPLALPTGDTSLAPLRDALLAQISKGAAEGVVEIIDGAPRPARDPKSGTDAPWSRISIGEMPGLKSGTDRTGPSMLTESGQACLTDDELDIETWGMSGDISSQIGLARSGLLAEFDAAVPEAVLRAVRYHIYLGFGAEARQFLAFLPPDAVKYGRILNALSHIVDGEPAIDSPFKGMQPCESSAAMWAILAQGQQAPLPPATNAEAIARSFSALPVHLRQSLGGGLVDKFLAAGDEETARKLRDAILRSATEGNPEVDLMDARFQLADGDDLAAAKLAAGVLQNAGPATAKAAITVVEAAFRGNRQIDAGLPSALGAFLREAHGTDIVPDLIRAQILAYAMQGDFDLAFALIDKDMDSFSDLWSLAAAGLADDAFLVQAARFSAAHPAIDPQVAENISRRLMDLGFADLALAWMGSVGPESGENLRLRAAQAHLMLRDAPTVLALLDGLTTPDALALQATAAAQLGDLRTSAEALLQGGDETAAQRTITWTQDWPVVAQAGPTTWRPAAELLSLDTKVDAAGPIARGTALVDESVTARATIEALLGSVKEPAASP
ncbi:MAG: hypothetical protein WAT09_13950 [Paracoccaceae bacterium]